LDVRIRIGVSKDSEELLKLADELIHLDNWSGREVMLEKSLRDPEYKIYVAEVDGSIVGFIELRVFSDFVEGAPLAIVQNLLVDKNHRNLGIGGRLLLMAIEEAKKRDVLELHVWTESRNSQAIDFYTKHGFKERALLLEKEICAACAES